MTSQREWEPSRIIFPEPRWTIAEDRAGRISSITTHIPEHNSDPNEIFNVNHFSARLIASCHTSTFGPTRISPTTTPILSDLPTPLTFVSGDRKSDVTPEALADKWHIGLETAKQTLKNTTQRILRSALLPLSRRYKADRIFQLPTPAPSGDMVFGHN